MIVNNYTITKIRDFKKFKLYLFSVMFAIFMGVATMIAVTIFNIIDGFKSYDAKTYFIGYATSTALLVMWIKISNSLILTLYSFKIYVLKETKYENNFFIKLWFNKKRMMWIKKWYEGNSQNYENFSN